MAADISEMASAWRVNGVSAQRRNGEISISGAASGQNGFIIVDIFLRGCCAAARMDAAIERDARQSWATRSGAASDRRTR